MYAEVGDRHDSRKFSESLWPLIKPEEVAVGTFGLWQSVKNGGSLDWQISPERESQNRV